MRYIKGILHDDVASASTLCCDTTSSIICLDFSVTSAHGRESWDECGIYCSTVYQELRIAKQHKGVSNTPVNQNSVTLESVEDFESIFGRNSTVM